jgi:hypothetical protein
MLQSVNGPVRVNVGRRGDSQAQCISARPAGRPIEEKEAKARNSCCGVDSYTFDRRRRTPIRKDEGNVY